MNYLWVIWLVVGAVLAISEIFTPTFFLLPIGLSCVISSIFAYFLPINLAYIPILICIVCSSLSIIFLRPLCIKFLYNKNTPQSNVDGIVGQILKAQSEISGQSIGTVKIYADIWKAKTEDGSVINAGEQVKVIRMDGNVLIVEKN